MSNKWFAVFLVLFLAITGFAALHAEASNYTRAIGYVLVSEGGSRYTNHPNDPGGPTKWGVTIHDVRRYLDPHATAQTVKDLTKEQALEIYHTHYAPGIQFDRLPLGVDYTLLDYSINAGQGRAAADLSRVLKLPIETRVTDLMVKAVRILDPLVVIQKLNDRRMDFQMGLGPKYNVFKRGWRNRINSTNDISLDMAGKQRKGFFRDVLIPMIGTGKAYEEETNGPI